MYADDFRRCLVECDVPGIRQLWKHVAPHLGQPETDSEALVAIHHARTQAVSIPFRLRAYSHRWLTDNGYPSGMPDHLKPQAERIYPHVVEAVGIAALNQTAMTPILQRAMSDAVMDAHEEGRLNDPIFVKARMMEARAKTIKQLIG